MNKLKLNCHPLSVNQAWNGRRFKTDDYKSYEIEVSTLLQPYKNKIEYFDGLVEIKYKWYLKYHKTTDYDNPIKPIQDILVKNKIIKDDRFIYKATIEKIPSEKDKIEIEIKKY